MHSYRLLFHDFALNFDLTPTMDIYKFLNLYSDFILPDLIFTILIIF